MAIISAGDLEKFCYCPLSWSLKATGSSEALAEGRRNHERMADDLERIVFNERRAGQYEKIVLVASLTATALALIGLFLFTSTDLTLRIRVLSTLALFWIVLSIFLLYQSAQERLGLDNERSELMISVLAIMAMVVALDAVPFFGLSEEQAVLSEVFALLLLMGACVALYLSYNSAYQAVRLRKRSDVEGEITYIGEGARASTVLRSDEYGLAGKPDYILEIDGELVPVEVKTGRVPRGPLFSHILQVAAYCLLLEKEGNVSYGILKYGNQEHVIEFDADLRTLLLTKLEEMRAATVSGEVHRNHNRPGKCRSCSRRDLCPERLV